VVRLRTLTQYKDAQEKDAHLVDNNNIGEFNLINYKISDRPLIFRYFNLRSEALIKKLNCLKLLEKTESINNSDGCVNPRN